MPTLTTTEIAAFLAAPRHAVLAQTPQWPTATQSGVYLFEDDRFYISITTGTAKYRNLRRDPRLSLCIDGGHPDYRTVTIYGVAEFLPVDASSLDDIRWRIIRRYYTDEAAARRYAESTSDQPNVLLMVTPTRILSQDFN